MFGRMLGEARLLFISHRAAVLVLAATTGCGTRDGLNRQEVSGIVTFDRQPISSGAVLFEPATQESGTAVGATIRDGTFAISRSQGPTPGSYRVRIYSSLGIQAPPTKGQTENTPRPMVERLPARYNTRTKLRAQVAAEHVNRYRFDLTSSEASQRP